MSDEEYEESVKEVEANIALIEAYDELYEQVKKVSDVLESEGE